MRTYKLTKSSVTCVKFELLQISLFVLSWISWIVQSVQAGKWRLITGRGVGFLFAIDWLWYSLPYY